MKNKSKNIKIVSATLVILLTLTACGMKQDGNKTVIKDPGKNITIIDNENNNIEEPSITVEKIERYERMEITDWLDEETIILSKENPELGKMTLLENSEFYPRSIYMYNLDTKEYKTIRSRKNMFLGGAKLSPDKNHILYYEYSIGDMAYYLMDMGSIEEQPPVQDEVLGGAISAAWSGSENIIGPSYAGGAFLSDTDRNIIHLPELEGEQLYTVQKVNDKVYYITFEGPSLQLYMLDMLSKEKVNLNLENADRIIPSPDGKQLLITQWAGSIKKLIVTDSEGNILRTVAEGNEITGASWSPDQLMISYHLKAVVDGVESSGLYLYDILSGESMQIAVNIDNANITWSPSGKKIAINESSEGIYNSSIIYLK